MNTRLATTLVIGALILPVAGYAADTQSVKESVRENISDAVITTRIKAEYAKDKDVSALKIKVDTDDKGVVTLSGNAKSVMEADKAVKIARDTKGVSSVKNEIKVQASKDEPKTVAPVPLAAQQDIRPSSVPTPPPAPPNAVDDGIQRPTPGQANDHSSSAFKSGGVPDEKK
jgi:thiazole synthase ThiGH ThiG subunit